MPGVAAPEPLAGAAGASPASARVRSHFPARAPARGAGSGRGSGRPRRRDRRAACVHRCQLPPRHWRRCAGWSSPRRVVFIPSAVGYHWRVTRANGQGSLKRSRGARGRRRPGDGPAVKSPYGQALRVAEITPAAVKERLSRRLSEIIGPGKRVGYAGGSAAHRHSGAHPALLRRRKRLPQPCPLRANAAGVWSRNRH